LGELVDKISILEIKLERIDDALKRENVRRELEALVAVRDSAIPSSADLVALTAELKAINAGLWDIEDALRACERARDFGARFGVEFDRSLEILHRLFIAFASP
jgi:hypothetical protein